MLELSRSVRFCISFADNDLSTTNASRDNTFAAWPSIADVGVFYEIEVCCTGDPDPLTGYLMSISRIDDVVRRDAIPMLRDIIHAGSMREPGQIVHSLLITLQPALDQSVQSLVWKLTPFLAVAMEADAMDRFSISQQFEFAAAHRLHCPELSDEENRRVFGNCNNPHGHGHNYRLEVSASVPMPAAGRAAAFTLPDLERIVSRGVIQRFDHKHLNLDTAEFAQLNPSVENIARVCHNLLAPPIDEAGATLEHVTVWETEKTCCTYPARRGRC